MKIYISDKFPLDKVKFIKKDFPKAKFIIVKDFDIESDYFVVEKKSRERFICKIDSFSEYNLNQTIQ